MNKKKKMNRKSYNKNKLAEKIISNEANILLNSILIKIFYIIIRSFYNRFINCSYLKLGNG